MYTSLKLSMCTIPFSIELIESYLMPIITAAGAEDAKATICSKFLKSVAQANMVKN